jgi:hypothetical protein
MDPYWTFDHSHKLNKIQKAPNERQQKSNYFYFHDKDYDALLLGSSRVTFFNYKFFKTLKVFNYSFSLAMPQEYAPYVNFAKKYNDKPFKDIILGVDFFGTNKNSKPNMQYKTILNDITKKGYEYKLLFSIDSVETSLATLKSSLQNKHGKRSYDRELVATTTLKSEKAIKKSVDKTTIKDFIGDMKLYEYNEQYPYILQSLEDNNSESKFIVFTTPTTSHHLSELFKNGFYEDYKRWLRELVMVFPKIYHFMDFNSVTKNYTKHFMDYHHIYPKYTKYISDVIEGREIEYPDFGKILTERNIEEYLKKMDIIVDKINK